MCVAGTQDKGTADGLLAGGLAHAESRVRRVGLDVLLAELTAEEFVQESERVLGVESEPETRRIVVVVSSLRLTVS